MKTNIDFYGLFKNFFFTDRILFIRKVLYFSVDGIFQVKFITYVFYITV